MDIATLQTLLEEQILQAQAALQAQTGGAAICQIHKDGRVTGGLKYEEGRLVALHTARRALSASQTFDPQDFVRQIESERNQWQSGLHAQQQKVRPAIAWVAYQQGGLDALENLLKILEIG